tara:strand:+ start:340 stop:624 length:285 start_codon:yes stop_codon:yes gene_type:complete
MSDDNGQEPDMSDKEKITANDYAIRNCLEKYDDPIDMVTYLMSCIDRELISLMASLVIDQALNDESRDHYAIKEDLSLRIFDALSTEVKHTHGI